MCVVLLAGYGQHPHDVWSCLLDAPGRSSLWRSRWFPRDSPFEVCNLVGVELSVARFRAQRSGASDLEFGSKVAEFVVSLKGNNFITLLLY